MQTTILKQKVTIKNSLEFLRRPIIGHSLATGAITKTHVKLIHVERLKQILQANGQKIEVATDYEAMIYIMTASLVAPLNHRGYEIYVHLFKKFYPQQSFLPNDGNLDDDILAKRGLARLKAWIYKASKKPREG